MRKVAFTTDHDNIKKVLLYECSDGVYVFGYDCLHDTAFILDYRQDTVEDAEKFCKDEYNIDSNNWLLIADPLGNCQHDSFVLLNLHERRVRKCSAPCKIITLAT